METSQEEIASAWDRIRLSSCFAFSVTPCLCGERVLEVRPDHQRPRNHVVQRLLASGEASHDVADEKNHP